MLPSKIEETARSLDSLTGILLKKAIHVNQDLRFGEIISAFGFLCEIKRIGIITLSLKEHLTASSPQKLLMKEVFDNIFLVLSLLTVKKAFPTNFQTDCRSKGPVKKYVR